MFLYHYGKYSELANTQFIAYDLEALFYDSYEGIKISRHLIYAFFCSRVERKETVPQPMHEFLASELRKVIDFKGKRPKKMEDAPEIRMFFPIPKGKKSNTMGIPKSATGH